MTTDPTRNESPSDFSCIHDLVSLQSNHMILRSLVDQSSYSPPSPPVPSLSTSLTPSFCLMTTPERSLFSWLSIRFALISSPSPASARAMLCESPACASSERRSWCSRLLCPLCPLTAKEAFPITHAFETEENLGRIGVCGAVVARPCFKVFVSVLPIASDLSIDADRGSQIGLAPLRLCCKE